MHPSDTEVLLWQLVFWAVFYGLGLPAFIYNMVWNKGTFAGSLLTVLLLGPFANILIPISLIGKFTDNRPASGGRQ